MSKILTSVFFILVILYVATYLALSLGGRYEASTFGLMHVKTYEWYFKGINNGFIYNTFYPLYLLDRKIWHQEICGDKTDYPINRWTEQDVENFYKSKKRQMILKNP